MASNGNCIICGQSLPPRHGKYCSTHSTSASLLWKRQARKAEAGEPYYLDWWLKASGDLEGARRAYNEYMSGYMRRRRLRERGRPTRRIADGTLFAQVV